MRMRAVSICRSVRMWLTRPSEWLWATRTSSIRSGYRNRGQVKSGIARASSPVGRAAASTNRRAVARPASNCKATSRFPRGPRRRPGQGRGTRPGPRQDHFRRHGSSHTYRGMSSAPGPKRRVVTTSACTSTASRSSGSNPASRRHSGARTNMVAAAPVIT